jgi:hypothetical protein
MRLVPSSVSNDLLDVRDAAAGDFLRTGAGETLVVKADFFKRGAGDFFTGTGDLETGRFLVDLGRIDSGDLFLASAVFLAFFSAA